MYRYPPARVSENRHHGSEDTGTPRHATRVDAACRSMSRRGGGDRLPHACVTRCRGEPMNGRTAHRWQAFAAAMPGLGVSFLVAAQCPACWLAYAGLLPMPGVAWCVGETSR